MARMNFLEENVSNIRSPQETLINNLYFKHLARQAPFLKNINTGIREDTEKRNGEIYTACNLFW